MDEGSPSLTGERLGRLGGAGAEDGEEEEESLEWSEEISMKVMGGRFTSSEMMHKGFRRRNEGRMKTVKGFKMK